MLVQAEGGPVNIKVLAYKLATGRDRPPGEAKEHEGYDPVLEEQLRNLPALEKRLYRYAKDFCIPSVGPGRPRKVDK